MNRQELLQHLNIKPKSIKTIGSASIISTDNKKYVIKKKNRKADSFDYLQTRNFNNFPQIYSSIDDEVELMDYIEDQDTPKEQRLQDLVYLTSMLHNKTTFYKTVDEDFMKEIYERVIDRQNIIYQYYSDLQDMIELEVYMSPAHYLLIRNISMIYFALNKSREYIEKWYSLLKEEKKVRYAYIHGNLEEKHLIEAEDLYFISWDQSRVDFPIYDLEILYRKSFLDISLSEILEIYQLKYPLRKEEKYLLNALLLIPDKIDITVTEYLKTKQVTHLVLYMDKTLSSLEQDSKKTNHYTGH